MAISPVETELLPIVAFHRKNRDFRTFLLLWPWLWHSFTKLTRIPSRCTRRLKMDFLRLGFPKLLYYTQKDRQR